MNKLIFFLSTIMSIYSTSFALATSSDNKWSGFYLGGNLGYWYSQNNDIKTTVSPEFSNPSFAKGSKNITNALVELASNNFSLNAKGFIVGAQTGYNYQIDKKMILGLDTDIDRLNNSDHIYTLQKDVNLIDFNEHYAGSMTFEQMINFLGTVRARIGYLYQRNLLIYSTGGFAYGNATLNTTWTAQESLGSIVYPPIITQQNSNQTMVGWTAGGGIEWFYKSNWSAKIEYTFYSLNPLNTSIKLEQYNQVAATDWGGILSHTSLFVSVGTIRAGINYHFS